MEALDRRIAVTERQRAADLQRATPSGSSDDFGLESEPSPRSVRMPVGLPEGQRFLLHPMTIIRHVTYGPDICMLDDGCQNQSRERCAQVPSMPHKHCQSITTSEDVKLVLQMSGRLMLMLDTIMQVVASDRTEKAVRKQAELIGGLQTGLATLETRLADYQVRAPSRAAHNTCAPVLGHLDGKHAGSSCCTIVGFSWHKHVT